MRQRHDETSTRTTTTIPNIPHRLFGAALPNPNPPWRRLQPTHLEYPTSLKPEVETDTRLRGRPFGVQGAVMPDLR